MVLVIMSFKMEIFMKVILQMEKLMEKEFIKKLMELIIKVCFSTTRKVVMGKKFHLMEQSIKENF